MAFKRIGRVGGSLGVTRAPDIKPKADLGSQAPALDEQVQTELEKATDVLNKDPESLERAQRQPGAQR